MIIENEYGDIKETICYDTAEDLTRPLPPIRKRRSIFRKPLTWLIKLLSYIAVVAAYGLGTLAYGVWSCLGWWSLLIAGVLFPFVMVIVNIITFPANALNTWANLRNLVDEEG